MNSQTLRGLLITGASAQALMVKYEPKLRPIGPAYSSSYEYYTGLESLGFSRREYEESGDMYRPPPPIPPNPNPPSPTFKAYELNIIDPRLDRRR